MTAHRPVVPWSGPIYFTQRAHALMRVNADTSVRTARVAAPAKCADACPQPAMNTPQFVIGIVDDDDALRTAIASLLRSEGYAVEAFGSAEGFLRALSRVALLCLIVDVRLPGMSGLELLQRLAASGCGVPAICITAQKDPDGRVREHALRMGAQDLLYKPFEAEDLLRAVGSIRDRGRHHP